MPTPPQSPRPIPPERTPRKMKTMTRSPWTASRNPVRRGHRARLLLAVARTSLDSPSAARSSGSWRPPRRRLPARPPRTASTIVRDGRRELLDVVVERVRLVVEQVFGFLEVVLRAARPAREPSSAACSPFGRVGNPARSIASTIVSTAPSASLQRDLRRTEPPCGDWAPFSVCSLLSDRRSRNDSTMASILAAPDADRAAHVLRPLARRHALAAVVADHR